MKNNNRPSLLALASIAALGIFGSDQAAAGLVLARPELSLNVVAAPSSAAPTSLSLASSQAPEGMWVPVPEQALSMCVAGVCLGQSITYLPVESASIAGNRVAGQWLIHGSSSSLTLPALQAIDGVCKRSDLPAGTERKIQIVFKPLDGSASGLMIFAEPVPRKAKSTASPYLVTEIELSTNAGNGGDARIWPAQVEKLWPQLRPVLMDDASGATLIETWWATAKPVAWPANAGKGSSNLTHEVRYSVEPKVGIDVSDAGLSRWATEVVKHSLIWEFGWTPASALEALSLQPECLHKSGADATFGPPSTAHAVPGAIR